MSANKKPYLTNFNFQVKSQLKGLFSFLKEKRQPSEKRIDLLAKIKRLEEIIQEEKFKTEKLKSVFLNNVYHEIRTPMNSIIGFSELLQQENLTPAKRRSFISKVRESSENFLYTIDQLVLVSLIETGNIKITKEHFNLDEMIEDIHKVSTFQKHMKNKNQIALLKNTDKYYPNLIIFTDHSNLHHILLNLIDNALKFTDKGVVEYGYKMIDNNEILFFVSDSGIGINDDPNIFDKFYKSNYIFNKENKGLGLGLCIAKELIKLIGGNIWLEANALGGSTFKFILPFEKPVQTIKEKVQQAKSKKHIMFS